MVWQFLSRIMELPSSFRLGEIAEQLIDEVAVRLPRWRHAAAPKKPSIKPWVEVLPDRIVPATVAMYWDPTNLLLASNPVNWDTGSVGTGIHPPKAPGQTNGETDNIYFDGTNVPNKGQVGNRNCTWDYNPTNTLGSVIFQSGYNQTVTFNPQQGFKVSATSQVTGGASPTITPNGGMGAVAAITLTGGTYFNVDCGSTLNLQDVGTGGAIFMAGDGNNAEYLNNVGTVSYKGVSGVASLIDYLNVPVHNGKGTTASGVFKINGNGDGSSSSNGAGLQVTGAATTTHGVSFYQDDSAAETDISGNGTLWCVNDFWMDAGLLQTKDSVTDYLKVGVGGNAPVDGTVTLNGGTVNINPGNNIYGTLQILGTTGANNPIVNDGAATINIKVQMSSSGTQPDAGGGATNKSDVLIVGKTGGTGTINFDCNGGTSYIKIIPQGTTTPGHQWLVLYFGKENNKGQVITPQSFKQPVWETNDLIISN